MEENKLTIEELFNKLEETVSELSGDVSLEKSFALYEQGMKLVHECEQQIDTVEKKVLELNERGTTGEFS